MAFSANMYAKTTCSDSSTADNITLSSTISKELDESFASADKVYSKDLTITPSGTDINLTSVTDTLGESLEFDTIYGIVLINNSSTTGESITITEGSSSGLDIGITNLEMGSTVLKTFPDGLDVSATDGIINFTADASGSSVSMDIIIIGIAV